MSICTCIPERYSGWLLLATVVRVGLGSEEDEDEEELVMVEVMLAGAEDGGGWLSPTWLLLRLSFSSTGRYRYKRQHNYHKYYGVLELLLV